MFGICGLAGGRQYGSIGSSAQSEYIVTVTIEFLHFRPESILHESFFRRRF